MAKADTDKEAHINGDDASAEGSEVVGDSAAVPSTSTKQNDIGLLDNEESKEENRPAKRRASVLSDASTEDFQGFGDNLNLDDSAADISKLIEHMEHNLSTASLNLTPIRHVTVGPHNPQKRLRKETDNSRPSSALSTKSDSDGVLSNTEQSTTPSNRGRKHTIEMSSPLFRVPLEKGWKRELVYRAALDHHSRRQADIYYYTPQGKKLRSTREVAEHLSGSGLTLENFSFFKEPLGVDDPEKEIIRGAKLLRRSDAPVTSPAPVILESKRTPKPKTPKGSSPEPATKLTTPFSKIKVKSFGSRLSGTSTPNLTPTVASKRRHKSPSAPTPAADNNNTAAKKPRLQASTPPPAPSVAEIARAQSLASLSSPPHPCSMSCGRARGMVPTLSCVSCLCLYHPACVEFRGDQDPTNFFCKNCRVASSSLDSEPSPRSDTTPDAGRLTERVTIRIKMSGGGPGGARQWSVRGAVPGPQGVAKINGRQYIVVARTGQY